MCVTCLCACYMEAAEGLFPSFRVVIFQVRESDASDVNRDKCVQLLDDFKIHGMNGTRIRTFAFLLIFFPLFLRFVDHNWKISECSLVWECLTTPEVMHL